MSYEIKFKKVNDISNADICVYNAKNEKSIKTVKVVETLDHNQTHPLKQSDIIKDTDRSEITSQLKYESVRADAMDMAYILDKIDDCLRLGCQCGGDYKGGIPYEQTVERLCKIMYSNTVDYQKWLTRNQTKNEKEN